MPWSSIEMQLQSVLNILNIDELIGLICFIQIIHYELPNDPETFVHRSGRTGRAGKLGTAILMFTGSQRRTVRSLERDVGCKFEFVNAPSVEDVLESSAEQVVVTLNGVHPESIAFFTPTAQKLIEEKGTTALAAALAQLSGFSQPPSSRSLITHEQVLEACISSICCICFN